MNVFTNLTFWEKVYVIYGIIVVILAIKMIIYNYENSPRKILSFIENAYNDGRMVVGKMTCLTLHGYTKPTSYEAEYMYVLDNKRYFVTYEMAYSVDIDDRKDKANADMLLLNLKPAMILFYDKKNPGKVRSKFEIFTSSDGIHQIKTKKKNIWRDIEKDWTAPIDLVKY